MKTTWAGLAALSLALLVPAETRASGLELRLGGFQPQANANLFEDTAELFGTRDRDWRGLSGGVEFAMGLGDRAEVGVHLDGYGRTLDTSYVDFVRDDGSEIFQTLRLNVVPLGVTLRFLPLGDRATVSPYVAAGADVFFYKYEEFGEFIDFFADNEILEDSFVSDGAAGGFHVAAGLRVPVSHDFAVTGEVRHQWAKADMADDFRESRIDLGGTHVTVGFHVRF
jgi:hypothetical protein